MATENIVVNISANAEPLKPTIDLLVKMGVVAAKDAEEFKKLIAASSQFAVESKKAATEAQKLSDSLPGGKSNPKPSAEVEKANTAFKSLKTQLSEAKTEAARLAQEMGEFSPQAIDAANRAAILDDRMKDLNKTLAALNPEAKLTAFLKLGTGISGAFTAAQGAMALFGEESEDVQKAILRVQGALALTQGLNSVLQLKDAFRDLRIVLGVTAVAGQTTAASIKAVSAALILNPITLLVAALGTLLAALISTKNALDDVSKSSAKTKEETQKHADALFELETEYLLATGAITEFDAALRKLSLETHVKQSELVAQATEKANEETDTWLKTILRGINVFGLLSNQLGIVKTREDEFNANLKKQTELLKEQFDKIEDIRKAQEKLIEARKAEKDRQDALEKEKEQLRELGKGMESLKVTFQGLTAEQINLVKLTDELAEALSKGGNTWIDYKNKMKEASDEMAKIPDRLGQTKKEINDTTEILDDGFLKLRNALAKIFPDQDFTTKQLQFIQNSLEQFAKEAEDIFFGIFDNIAAGFRANAEAFEAEKEARLEAFDEELDGLEELNNNKIISDGLYAQKQKELAKQREAAEKELNKKIADEKRKAFIANRAASLAEIAINTAVSATEVSKNIPFPASIPFIAAVIAFGLAQSGIVLSQPIPKFKKGVIGLKGQGTETSDSIPAMLSRGESVMTAQETKKFEPTLLAIRKNRISPELLNAFSVNHNFGAIEASIDTGKLTRSSRKLIPHQADAIGRSVAKHLGDSYYYSPLRN